MSINAANLSSPAQIPTDALSLVLAYLGDPASSNVSRAWKRAFPHACLHLLENYEKSPKICQFVPEIEPPSHKRAKLDETAAFQRVKKAYSSVIRYVRPTDIPSGSSPLLLESLISIAENRNLVAFFECLILRKVLTNKAFPSQELPNELSAKAQFIRNWMRTQQRALGRIPVLDLSGIELTLLPPEIHYFSGLTALNLAKNSLLFLPEEIGNLTNLETLLLWENRLTSLPEEIGNLTNLEILLLRENRLTSLPKEIGNLTNLHHFDISFNSLFCLPPQIGNLTNLAIFSADGNKLFCLPLEFGNLANLEHLSLDNTQLLSFPPNISHFTRLKILSLSSNLLSFIPPEIGNLANLQELFLDDNYLRYAPPAIGRLARLQTLSLKSNYLDSLPTSEMAFLPRLHTLDLSYNRIVRPEEVIRLQAFSATRNGFEVDLQNQGVPLPRPPPFQIPEE